MNTAVSLARQDILHTGPDRPVARCPPKRGKTTGSPWIDRSTKNAVGRMRVQLRRSRRHLAGGSVQGRIEAGSSHSTYLPRSRDLASSPAPATLRVGFARLPEICTT